jgi:hypothetical protein
LFYAGLIPVTGVQAHVEYSLTDGASKNVHWVHEYPRYELSFTLANGRTRSAKLGLPREGKDRQYAILKVPHMGNGLYLIGLVQAGELAPSLRAISGNLNSVDEPRFDVDSGSEAKPPDPAPSADSKWHGIDPANYRFIVFTAINRRFPGAMPSTRPYGEALAAATAVLGEITDIQGPKEPVVNQLAVKYSDWRGEAAGAPTLAAYPGDIPPSDVIDAAKSLQPGEVSPTPIDAEDGIYVVVRIR